MTQALDSARASLHVVILAAGQGKRMRSARPKVLQDLAGRSLLAHVLHTAHLLQPDRITVVIGHGGDQVRAAFPDADVQWVDQHPPQGTGHAVRCALQHCAPDSAPATVLVLYGDVPLLRSTTLQPLVQAAAAGDVALLTQYLEQPQGYGRIVRTADGRVQAIVEQKDATDAQRAINEVNTGILAAPMRVLYDQVNRLQCNNAQGEYYLTDCVAQSVQQGLTVQTFHPAAAWEAEGVNDPLQLEALERQWQRVQACELLLQGVRLRDAGRIDIRGELKAGTDCEIDVGCVFEGKVELGDGVRIGAHAVLKNVRIGNGCQIKPFSHLDGVVLGQACEVGPYARLRPGTRLEDGAHIGNFVETKNTVLGADSKAGHLTYLGDATIGARVNVGAGVITCNYDGANKHRTVIGDDAFIGSDSQLVAPVEVGAGATIAAGTTLTRTAAPNALTLTRVPQRTVTGWKRPQKRPAG